MKSYEHTQIVQGLYGSEFEMNKACAYCKHHSCYLTVKQAKRHNCLGKQCWYFEKNENHDWWHQREVTKQRRKEKKRGDVN